MKKEELKSRINNAKSISELIDLVNEFASQDPNDKVLANSVKADLKRIQNSAQALMELSKVHPVVPGVNTPVNWTEFPGLSEKMVQLAMHQHRPTPLKRQSAKQDIKSPDKGAPVKDDHSKKQRKKH